MNDERTIQPDATDAPEVTPAAELVELAPAGGSLAVATPGPSRRRWIIAAVITAAVLAGSVVLAGLLAGRSTPEVLRYVSPDAFIVFEFRPELPGDQRAKVGELLSHFPGFKDQSTLEQKIDESFDLIVNRLSNGETNYRADVKPYLGGPAVFAVSGFQNDDRGNPPFLLVMTTDGTADCQFPDDVRSHTEAYEGLEVHVADTPVPIACVIDGTYAIVGAPGAVRGAIDTRADGRSIADDQAYRTAQASLPDDHVGAVFVNAGAMVDEIMASSEAPGDVAMAVDYLPAWFAGQVRAEDDALVLSGVSPIPAGWPAAPGPDHASVLAGRIPGTAVAAFEGHDIGATIRLGLDALANDDATNEMATQLQAGLQQIGGLDALTGWMGDVALVLTMEGDALGGGIVLEANDEAKAAAALASIRNLIALSGGGTGIGLDQVDHDGTTIYIVDPGDGASLFGLPTDAPVDEAGTLPVLAFAQRDDLVVVGITQAFVEAVLDTGDDDSLADHPGYQRAIERAGASNASQGYVDLAAILEHVRSTMTGDEAAHWDANIKPWIAPFEGVAYSAIRGDDHMRGRVVITVR